jgi:hypothetical protein
MDINNSLSFLSVVLFSIMICGLIKVAKCDYYSFFWALTPLLAMIVLFGYMIFIATKQYM